MEFEFKNDERTTVEKAIRKLPIRIPRIEDVALKYVRPKFFKFDSVAPQEIQRVSMLNSPVYDGLTFFEGVWVDEDGFDNYYPELNFDSVLVRVSRKKNIVKTTLAARNGTVKEHISFGDYEIQVDGFLVSEDRNSYPTDLIREFHLLANSPEQVKLKSKLLDLFEIDTVVIENWSVKPEVGKPNSIPFSMKLSSDDDLILQVNETTEL